MAILSKFKYNLLFMHMYIFIYIYTCCGLVCARNNSTRKNMQIKLRDIKGMALDVMTWQRINVKSFLKNLSLVK